MQELYQSIVKTENSFIDNVSIKDQREGNDYADKIEEFKNILKWVHKRGTVLGNVGGEPPKKPSSYSFHMIKIESISNLLFKKSTISSKVYVVLTAKLINTKSNRQYHKVTRIVKVLEQTNTYMYELREPLCFYFYTHCENELLLKIQILMYEQDIKHQHSIPFFSSAENGGYIEIDFKKDHKGKEKKAVIPPNQFSFGSREGIQATNTSNAAVVFTALRSDVYRYLQRIVSQHTLCDPSDKIAGIMGYYLPLSQNALTDFALTPQAQGLHLSFASIQMSSQIMKEATARAEHLIKNKYSSLAKVNSSIGDIVLHVNFHNGWRVVSSGSTIIKQKGDLHLKTNNSNMSEQINIQTNKKTTGKATDLPIKIKNQYKRYACENTIELSLVFPQQEQCVLIYQITMDIIIKGQMPTTQKKDLPDSIQEIISFPLCFGINSAKSIGNYRSNTCGLNLGGCLTSFQHLKEAIQQNFKQITTAKRTQASKTIVQSKNKIPSIVADFDSVSNNNNNKTLKTLDNVSQFSWKNLKNQIGSLDFEMQLIEKQQNIQDNMNLSIPLQNFSSLNASKMDIKDKIQNQKERIAKQSKKTMTIQKATSNRLDIGFIQQITISQHQKNQLLSKIYPPKDNSYYVKQAFLKVLKQQVSKNYQKPINPRFQIPSKLKNERILRAILKNAQEYLRTLYSINLPRLQPQSIIQHKISKYFYYLHSNYIIHEKYYFRYEQTPLQIIKTQLSQINYNNCYFINFIEISNHINNQIVKFPKVFYFKLRFYNQDEVRSELMTVNKDTGEILLVNSEKSTDKIIHMEIDIDEQPNNFVMKFIQFIQYLNNGVLNVQIVDYFTGLTFGVFTIPLRNLIRKRRNEVVYVHEDWIYHRNMVRGNMKVEVRAIRKMKHRIKIQQIQQKSPQKSKQPSPVKEAIKKQTGRTDNKDTRLDRIQRFKQNKNKNNLKQPQSQLKSQITHVNKIISKAYVSQKTKIMVSYLKKQFFFLQISNKHDTATSYRVSIKDEDQKWIQKNPLSGQEEITLVKNPQQIEKDDYEILTSSKKSQEKMLKCFKVNEQQLIEMAARGKGYLLFCYLTVRRYRPPQETISNSDLIVYNRQRTISCSFINEKDGSIQSINTVDIIPLPQQATIELEYYRPAEEQSLIHIPFIDPQYLSAKIDQILIDDPYTLVLPASNSSLPLIDKFTSLSSGIYVQISNDIPQQSFKQYNVLLLADVRKKQVLLGESRKNDRRYSRMKSQSRLVVEPIEDIVGPKMVSLTLRVWGCLKFVAQVPLWGQVEGYISIPNQIFNKNNTKCFFLASDDEASLRFYQDKKNKFDHLQALKVDQNSTATQVYYAASSHLPNESYISVHAIDGNQAIIQEDSLKTKSFTYMEPFYRAVMVMQTFIPTFKELLKINVNRASMGILEEPFTYRSSCNKKAQFKIYSSDASLVWVKNNDSVFQIDGKAERKIHISFHTQKIIQRNALTGSCEGIVLGVKWDKGIDYYGFKFNVF